MQESHVKLRNLLIFILGSAFGAFMFLVPIPQGKAFTTVLDYLVKGLKGVLGPSLSYILLAVVTLAAVLSLYNTFCKPEWLQKNDLLRKNFSSSPFYLVSKVLGAVMAWFIVFKAGPQWLISEDTGASMIGLCNTLLCIVTAFSFFLPFLTDCGIMEFLGVIMRPVVNPLFRVPGRASVDLIASWFGASNAAVILTREQYMKGMYTAREAGYIMTNFSVVSIPFCLLIANVIKIPQLFPAFYLCICVVGVILAFIIARIPPITLLPNTYRAAVGKNVHEDVPEEMSLFSYAVENACRRASTFTLANVLRNGFEIVFGMFFDLIPIVVSWGVVALCIATYTPVFDWISYPMGLYLQLLGVEEAFKAAPATLIGFTDMFIPALLLGGVTAVKTKFIVGVLSLIQIIYMTEVGAIVIKSEVPLGFGGLLAIFLERTIIAIPLIVAFANIVL